MATPTHTDAYTERRVAGRGWTIASFVLAAASLIFALLAAIPGLICGFVGRHKGDPLATWAIVANVLLGIVGWLIGLALLSGV